MSNLNSIQFNYNKITKSIEIRLINVKRGMKTFLDQIPFMEWGFDQNIRKNLPDRLFPNALC